MAVGLMTALAEEGALLAAQVKQPEISKVGPREFVRGRINDREVIVALSQVGKVAAATTTTILLHHFNVKTVLFTGLAGGIGPGVGVGDVVVADHLMQHDFDTKGVLGVERFVIPSLGVARFPTSERLLSIARGAAQKVVEDKDYRAVVERLAKRRPEVRVGLVASGDRFVGSSHERNQLLQDIPDLLAVEMEGAAVAQVCAEYGASLVVARIISDDASDTAHVNFRTFVDQAAAFGAERFVMECISGI